MSRQPVMPCLVLILLLFCTASVNGFAIGVRKDDTTTLLEPGRTCADHLKASSSVRAARIIAIKLLPRPCPSVSPLQFSIPARGFKTHAKRGDGCWFELSLSFVCVCSANGDLSHRHEVCQRKQQSPEGRKSMCDGGQWTAARTPAWRRLRWQLQWRVST